MDRSELRLDVEILALELTIFKSLSDPGSNQIFLVVFWLRRTLAVLRDSKKRNYQYLCSSINSGESTEESLPDEILSPLLLPGCAIDE